MDTLTKIIASKMIKKKSKWEEQSKERKLKFVMDDCFLALWLYTTSVGRVEPLVSYYYIEKSEVNTFTSWTFREIHSS